MEIFVQLLQNLNCRLLSKSKTSNTFSHTHRRTYAYCTKSAVQSCPKVKKIIFTTDYKPSLSTNFKKSKSVEEATVTKFCTEMLCLSIYTRQSIFCSVFDIWKLQIFEPCAFVVQSVFVSCNFEIMQCNANACLLECTKWGIEIRHLTN